jgi:hypothetical protein
VMRRRLGRELLRCALLLSVASTALPLASCGGGSEYRDAAGGLAVMTAATAVHRAATGDCWGRCSPGYSCNRESGFCERGDCDPACPGGMVCTVTPTGTECRGDPATLSSF